MSERKRVQLCVRASGAMPGHSLANVKAHMPYIPEGKRVLICVRASGVMPGMIQAMPDFCVQLCVRALCIGIAI